MIKPFGEVMQSKPKERDTEVRTDAGRYLHDLITHEPGAWSGKVHVPTGDESRVQR